MKGVYSSRHPAHGGCISRSSSFVYSPCFFCYLWASSQFHVLIACEIFRPSWKDLHWDVNCIDIEKLGNLSQSETNASIRYCYCYHYWTWTIVVTLTRLSFLQNPCRSSPCLNNGTCQAGFTRKGFRCRCHKGFSGRFCDRIGMAQSHEQITLLVLIVKFFL